MQTWLDWYVHDATASLQHIMRLHDATASLQHIMNAGIGNREAMRLMIVSALARYTKNARDNASTTQRTFLSVLLPFFLDPEDTETDPGFDIPEDVRHALHKGRGIRPDTELVAALLGASPSTEVRKSARSALRTATWYVDLPHRSLMLDNRTQIRALFAQPTRRADAMYMAILTSPGSNTIAGRYAWVSGADNPADDDVVFTDIQIYDSQTVRRVAEDFLHLLLAYQEVAADAIQQPVPRYTDAELQSLPRKRQKALRNKASLFQITDLRPPRDRFQKKRTDDVGTNWKLTHTVTVRGHFRWQLYGPGRTLRKLRWIDAYERGHGERKPTLEKVHAPNTK